MGNTVDRVFAAVIIQDWGAAAEILNLDADFEHATIHPSHHPSQTGPHRIRYGEDTLDLTLTSQEPITISAS